MSKLNLIPIILLLTTQIALASNVIISEVLYDPALNQKGGEAIELFNPTNNSIDLSNYIIKTKSSDKDATIPNNTMLLPYQFYLIADINYSFKKDNETFVNADHEEDITLANSAGGIALISDNIVIDSVGWGNLNETDLFETQTANKGTKGFSLQRKNLFNDTNNNFVDFEYQLPSLMNSSFLIDIDSYILDEEYKTLENETAENLTIGLNESEIDQNETIIYFTNSTLTEINETNNQEQDKKSSENKTFIKVELNKNIPNNTPNLKPKAELPETETNNSITTLAIKENIEEQNPKTENTKKIFPKEQTTVPDDTLLEKINKWVPPTVQLLVILSLLGIISYKLLAKT